eukprot:5529498-Amphidinium_carterae.2
MDGQECRMGSPGWLFICLPLLEAAIETLECSTPAIRRILEDVQLSESVEHAMRKLCMGVSERSRAAINLLNEHMSLLLRAKSRKERERTKRVKACDTTGSNEVDHGMFSTY